MTETMSILDYAVGPVVKSNAASPRNWGVSFEKFQNEWCAYIGSAHYAAEVRNVPEPPAAFYSFYDSAWHNTSQYPNSNEVFRKAIGDSLANCKGMVRFNFAALVNWLDEGDVERKSRIILAQDGIEAEHDVLLKFKDCVAEVKGHKFLVSDESPIIKPMNGIPYRCRVVGETGNDHIVAVVAPYHLFKMGVMVSSGIYLPASNESVDRLEACYAVTGAEIDGDIGIGAIHLDCTYVKDILQILRSTGAEEIQIHIPMLSDAHELQPTIFIAEGPTSSGIAILGPLNKKIVGGAR